jgi:hypothetical protein
MIEAAPRSRGAFTVIVQTTAASVIAPARSRCGRNTDDLGSHLRLWLYRPHFF